MAKIILSSRYIKNPARSNAGKLVRYMGTREGVEKLPNGVDNSPSTVRQQNLIRTITNHFKDTKNYHEYEDYISAPTKSNASEFIDAAIERNADRTDELKSLTTYIAERPGVEKLGKHGLFSATDDKINLDEIADKVSQHGGIVFTHVVSLKREDAERLGFNNAEAWKKLARRNEIAIAEAHKIAPTDLEWYAAFHDTGNHPHMHMIVMSKSNKGYLTKKGIRDMKSVLGRDIFRDDQYKLYVEQTGLRNELKNSVYEILNDLSTNKVRAGYELRDLMQKLQTQLEACKGKKVYGYLPKDVKKTVNDILKLIAQNPKVADIYAKWNEINRQKISLYHDSRQEPDIPLEENKEFRSIKNAIIKAVMNIDFTLPSYMQTEVSSHSAAASIVNNIVSLIAEGCDLLINNVQKKLPKQTDKVELTKIQEKKIAHGQRIDEVPYEEEEDQDEGFGLIM